MAAKISKEKVRAQAIAVNNEIAASAIETKVFDLPKSEKGQREGVHSKNPYVVLKYFDSEWECFSAWEKSELSAFSNFLRTFSKHTWSSVYKTSGKSENKAGLAYTPYKPSEMKAGSDKMQRILDKIDPELVVFELRVSQKLRVHGFQSHAAFFLVYLDREHRVFPQS